GIRPPCRDRKPSTGAQCPAHLARRNHLVGEELQPLLTDDDVELLVVIQGKRSRLPLAPLDIRSDTPRYRKHVRTDINPYVRPGFAEAFARDTRRDAGSEDEGEHTIRRQQADGLEGDFGPRLEQGAGEPPLV